jgi:hypothetical protein
MFCAENYYELYMFKINLRRSKNGNKINLKHNDIYNNKHVFKPLVITKRELCLLIKTKTKLQNKCKITCITPEIV